MYMVAYWDILDDSVVFEYGNGRYFQACLWQVSL
jgi:hypothetical protein